MSSIHCLPEGEVNPSKVEDAIEDSSILQELTSIVLKHFNHKDLKVGDVIHFDDCDDYRNDGKFLWGPDQCLINLDYEIDDYGAVPQSLSINRFPSVDHFSESIDHNNIVWFDRTGYTLTGQSIVGEDKYFNIPIHELIYSKSKKDAIGAELYRIYTYSPDLFLESNQDVIQLTHTDEFGHIFESPHSLFDSQGYQHQEEIFDVDTN